MEIGIGLYSVCLLFRFKGQVEGILAEPANIRHLLCCAFAAVALLTIGGEGHLFFTNWDWLWRDAVLADTSGSSFPPIYEIAGGTFVLRAPLGMYMVPALTARWFGLSAGHAALVVQNSIILTFILYGFSLLASRRQFLFLGLLVFFSGLDIIGSLLLAEIRNKSLSLFDLPLHLESWLDGLQYSSAITQLFWVPNHALPGWWLALLALLCARRDVSVGEFGLSAAATLFWSPLSFAGALPFVFFCFTTQIKACVKSVDFWVCGFAALCFLPIAVFLQADAQNTPYAFLLTSSFALIKQSMFLFIEIPQALIVLAAWKYIDRDVKGLAVLAMLILVVIPAAKLGENNDFVMRSSIPSLMILAFIFSKLLTEGLSQRRFLSAFAVALAFIGALTPLFEIARSLSFPAFAISHCNLVTVWQILEPKTWLTNYLADTKAIPGWLIDTSGSKHPLKIESAQCWPDYPFDPKKRVTDMPVRVLIEGIGHKAAP